MESSVDPISIDEATKQRLITSLQAFIEGYRDTMDRFSDEVEPLQT